LIITISEYRQSNRFQIYSFSVSVDTIDVIMTSSTCSLYGL